MSHSHYVGSLSSTLSLPSCEPHHGLVHSGAESQTTSPTVVTWGAKALAR